MGATRVLRLRQRIVGPGRARRGNFEDEIGPNSSAEFLKAGFEGNVSYCMLYSVIALPWLVGGCCGGRIVVGAQIASRIPVPATRARAFASWRSAEGVQLACLVRFRGVPDHV
eukprot:3673328-Prymnesium_polylepis.1